MRALAETPTNGKTAAVIAASYERVSTVLQATLGYSLAGQRAANQAFCAPQGWALPDDLQFRDGEDKNASGADWDLRDLNRMLDAARAGRFHVLVVPKHDRFARDVVKGLILVEQLKKMGISVIFLDAPIDGDTPAGELLSDNLFVFAKFERRIIKERMSKGRRDKARDNTYVGNCAPPYGYQYVREPRKNRVRGIDIREDQAAVVRRLYQDVLTTSIGDLARRLNAEGVPKVNVIRRRKVNGVPTPTDTHGWTVGAIRTILKNTLYTGHTRYADVEITNVPPIVTQEQFDAAQAALAGRRDGQPRPHAEGDDPFELRGVLRCAHCGGYLSSARNGPDNTWRYYRCVRHQAHRAVQGRRADCPMPGMPAPAVEERAWRVVTETLLDPAKLRVNLDAERRRYEEADRRRQERIATCDELIARAKKRIGRITGEILDVEPGSESHAALKERRATQEKDLQRLAAERGALAAMTTDGLTPEQAENLEEAARELRAGLEVADAALRQKVYRLLRVVATARLDPEGEQIGKYRIAIDYDAAIPLARKTAVDGVPRYQKLSVASTSRIA